MGARASGVFEGHSRWGEAEPYVQRLTEDDQHELHALIYEMKVGGVDDAHIERLKAIVHRYEVDCVIAGCSDLHLGHKRIHEWGYGWR